MTLMTTVSTDYEAWVPELTFAARLALVRHRMGWNIKEAAIACGVRPQSWRGWELERRLPHDLIGVVDAIAARTNVDPDWLLRGGPMRETSSAVSTGARVLRVVGKEPINELSSTTAGLYPGDDPPTRGRRRKPPARTIAPPDTRPSGQPGNSSSHTDTRRPARTSHPRSRLVA